MRFGYVSLDLALDDFVFEFHANNPHPNNFNHILSYKHMIKIISREMNITQERTTIAVYFHELTEKHQIKLKNFLRAFGHSEQEVTNLEELEAYSRIDSIPQTEEEIIMHDAHLLEGGPYYAIIKQINQGINHEETIETTLNKFEREVLPKYRCYFDYTRHLMKKQLDQSKEIINSLRKYLPESI